MARLIGPDEAVRVVYLTSGTNKGKASAQGMSAPIYADQALTTLADIVSTTDAAIADSTVTVDAYSKIPLFKFPDGADTVYTSVNGGPAVALYARTDDRLDTLGIRMTSVEAGGAGDALVVHKAGAETITGAKTFSAEPTMPTPTAAGSPTTKTYVDTADALKLAKASNLSDLASASTARTNLGLGAAAVLPVGTSTGTVAAGDDSRIVGAAQKAQNLADLADLAAARANLGLAIGTSAGTVAAGDDNRITAALVPRLRPAAPGPPVSTMLTRFDASHGWAYIQGSGVGADDTGVVGPFATQSASLTTATSGSTTAVEKSGLSVDLTTADLVVWIKWGTPNPPVNPAVSVYAGDSGLTDTYVWTVYREQTNSFNVDGWSVYQLFRGAAAAVGTPVPASTARIRVRGELNSGQVWVGGVGLRGPHAVYPNGVVTIGFDDSLASTYDQARPVLAAAAASAVCYAISDSIGTTGFMTLAQLQELRQNAGWEVAGHAYTLAAHNARYNTLTAPEVATEFRNLKAWMLANGFVSDAWASPGGQSTVDVWTAGRVFFTSHRGVSNGANYPNQSPRPVYPAHITGPSFDATTATVAQIQTYVDRVKTAKAWGHLTFHQVTTAASSAGSISATDLTTVLSYINAQSVPIRTVSEVLRGV